jgi:hypothetical protein
MSWLGVLTFLALAPGVFPQSTDQEPTDPGGTLDAPQEGRFVYLRSGAPIALQASPLYAAALMASQDPLMHPEELKRWIVDTGTELPSTTARRAELRLVVPKEAVLAAVESAMARDRESAVEEIPE